MKDSGDLLAQLSDLAGRLLALAEEGEWHALGNALQTRDALLARVGAADKRRVLADAQSCTLRLEQLVRTARSECADEIAALKVGRRAAVSYVTVQENST